MEVIIFEGFLKPSLRHPNLHDLQKQVHQSTFSWFFRELVHFLGYFGNLVLYVTSDQNCEGNGHFWKKNLKPSLRHIKFHYMPKLASWITF